MAKDNSSNNEGSDSTIEIRRESLEQLLHPDTGSALEVGLINTSTSPQGSVLKPITDAVISYIESEEYDIIVGPEYLFNQPRVLMNNSRKNSLLGRIAEATAGRNILVVPGTFIWQKDGIGYNTAYAISNGEVVYEHHKRDVASDTSIRRDRTTAFYGLELGQFEWNGFKIGIEICSDGGTLRKQEIKDKDMHLHVCHAKVDDIETAARLGGYYIKVDGKYHNLSGIKLING